MRMTKLPLTRKPIIYVVLVFWCSLILLYELQRINCDVEFTGLDVIRFLILKDCFAEPRGILSSIQCILSE